MNFIEELFFSDERKLIDDEIQNVINVYTTNHALIENIFYHIRPVSKDYKPTLEHSKRLRSFFCLLFGKENHHKNEEIVLLAVVVELIHNSTLIIDDIQDNDIMRCGEIALWKKIGIPKAINTAFYLANIAQAYFHKMRYQNRYYDYSELIINALDSIFNGQQIDLDNKGRSSMVQYKEMAFGKTGALILLSATMGCMPYNFDRRIFTLLNDFCYNFACFYQLRDDYTDIINGKTHFDNGHVLNFIDGNNQIEKIDNITKTLEIFQTKSYDSIDSLKINGVIISEKLKEIISAFSIQKITS